MEFFRPTTIACLCLGLAAAAARADFDPPPGYYNSATGSGATLKNQLHNLIDNHTVFSYGDARSLLQVTDEDPSDPDRVILVYDRVSIDVSVINPNGSIPGWDNAATWNREHTWPRSRGVNSSGPDDSDLHQLRPSTTSINSARGNRNFGGSFGQSFGQVGSFWYPGDADAGMIARQQFYVAVRYDGSDSATNDLELVGGNPGINGTTLGNLPDLIDWHYRAPPDDFERRRNDIVFGLQENRNPFVDHPEWVHSVFVDQANDTRLALAGATVGGNGGSTLDLNLGRGFVGGAGPTTTRVTLNKSGRDGVYYAATTSGAATSSVEGRLNAFATSSFSGVNGSEFIDVGLSVNTSQAGLTTGEVRFDNLDITTGGGAGRGANDADDVVSLSYAVLDHATPSWDAATELTELTLDFGEVDLGAATGDLAFGLFNLEQTIGFMSALEFDGASSTGDAGVLTLDLSAFNGGASIGGGSGELLSASIDASAAGDFEAAYTLLLSDEDLPGEQSYELTLNLLATVVDAGPAGDFNDDGFVNAADYAVLRDSSAGGAAYDDWVSTFGAGANTTLAATAVPEPHAAALLLAFLAITAPRRPRARAPRRSAP